MTQNSIRQGKFGARVFLMGTETVLVYQTIKRGTADNAAFVFDKNPTGSGEKFLNIGDDKGIADAIRAAFQGRL